MRAAGGTVGFVPTMGYLHDGHQSLMRAARPHHDTVLVSIFVNPLQFAPTEDLDAYPRDLARDTALCEDAGVDILFVPTVDEMYPAGHPIPTAVSVSGVSQVLEGASRPGHFDGVATVVAKLFSISGPCHAYFGEKDFQQIAVIAQMVEDLSIPATVVPCPTMRNDDGLALSSRNVYLSEAERAAAPVIFRALSAGAAAVRAGERDPERVKSLVTDIISAEPLGRIDYVAVVDPRTLRPPDEPTDDLRALAAVWFGKARLLDNVGTK